MKILEALHGFPTPENSDVSHLFQSLNFILIVKGLIGGGKKGKKKKKAQQNDFLCCLFNLSGLYLLMFDSVKHIDLSNMILHSLSASTAVFVAY